MLGYQLALVAICLPSLGWIRWLLSQPSRADERPVLSSPLPAFVLDDGYFDTKGMT